MNRREELLARLHALRENDLEAVVAAVDEAALYGNGWIERKPAGGFRHRHAAGVWISDGPPDASAALGLLRAALERIRTRLPDGTSLPAAVPAAMMLQHAEWALDQLGTYIGEPTLPDAQWTAEESVRLGTTWQEILRDIEERPDDHSLVEKAISWLLVAVLVGEARYQTDPVFHARVGYIASTIAAMPAYQRALA